MVMLKVSLATVASAFVILWMPTAGASAMGYENLSERSDIDQPTQGCTTGLPGVPLVALKNEAPPRLVANAPIPSQLAEGRVVISYCAYNIRILPVFGEAALDVSPRLGHLHITVDEGPYRWLDTSGQPIVVNKLPPGPHRILIELVGPTHKTIDQQVVSFVVPPLRSAQ
jgi:hypothetical protein